MSDKIDVAIDRLKTASEMSLNFYNEPLMITYSGGKDSDCLLTLAKMAEIPIEVVHSHTTADAPETVRYVRQVFKNLDEKGYKTKIEYPYYKGKRTSMWDLIVKKGFPPTRMIRYCCEILKETSGKNRHIATGVRWGESVKRSKNRGIYEEFNKNASKKIILNNDNDDKRKLFERCQQKSKTVTNPIVDWTTDEVIDFNSQYCKTKNPLYDCGFDRVGCIGCPMVNKKRQAEFARYPKYKELYIKSFDRMLKENPDKKYKYSWQNGLEVFKWWMGENPNQLNFFEEIEKMK